VDAVVADLVAQHAELSGVLGGLGESGWRAPTRCAGWDVADVVLHLAQTDELAVGSLTGRFTEVALSLAGGSGPGGSIDEGADALVVRERGRPQAEVAARWAQAASRLVELLDAMDLSTRVAWVTGEISARAMATTRLSETWIHTGDVADAVGISLPPTDRLRQIARLAWRTLPYAFSSAGRTMTGPVAFRLTSPTGAPWDYVPDEPAPTTVTGPAEELCAVAARRLPASATSLRGEGPDADDVLELVRTYA
jgi:uncharacterized protein (TIGR03084 family)